MELVSPDRYQLASSETLSLLNQADGDIHCNAAELRWQVKHEASAEEAQIDVARLVYHRGQGSIDQRDEAYTS